jgi:hypothetical protein
VGRFEPDRLAEKGKLDRRLSLIAVERRAHRKFEDGLEQLKTGLAVVETGGVRIPAVGAEPMPIGVPKHGTGAWAEIYKSWQSRSRRDKVRLLASNRCLRSGDTILRTRRPGCRPTTRIPPNNRLYDKDSSQPDLAVVNFVGEFDARYRFIRNNGAFFCFKTDLDAARSRLITIDIRKRERSNWKMIVPQTADTMSNRHAAVPALRFRALMWYGM